MTPGEAELHAMAADLTDEAGLRPHEAYRVLHGYPTLTAEQKSLARAYCADLAEMALDSSPDHLHGLTPARIVSLVSP